MQSGVRNPVIDAYNNLDKVYKLVDSAAKKAIALLPQDLVDELRAEPIQPGVGRNLEVQGVLLTKGHIMRIAHCVGRHSYLPLTKMPLPKEFSLYTQG
jgi:hypothetical protein